MKRLLIAALVALLPVAASAQINTSSYPNAFVSPILSGTVTGTYTLGGTPTITGLVGLNGFTGILGQALASGGNAYLTADCTMKLSSGTENAFFGPRSGCNVSAGGGNSSFGHNALGIGGGCSVITSNKNSAFGNDALRDYCGTGGGDNTALGAWALKNLGVGNSSPNAAQMTAVGDSSMWLLNNNNSGNASSALGYQSCAGAGSDGSPTGNFRGMTCLGALTGGAMTAAINSTLIGKGIGNSTFVNGTGVLLVGSGNVTVDTPAGNTSNYINVENIWTVTGTNTPSTSVTTIAGLATITGISTLSSGVVLAGTEPTVAASQVGFGGGTAASSNCNVAVPTPTACLQINVAGTTRYVPYY